MFPLLTGLITGGASLIGSIFSSKTASDNSQANIAMQQQTNQLNAEEAQKNRDFNSAQASMNRDFQQQMSNTAFQRSSEDMQAAGLNPMLMFGSGGPASTPGGSQASGSAAHFQSPRQENRSALAGIGDAVEKSVSSAISIKQFEKMTDEIANLKVKNAQIEAETSLTGQREKTEKEETLRRAVEAQLKQMDLPGARVRAREGEAKEEIIGDTVKKLIQGGYISEKTSGMTDQLGSLLGSATGLKRLLKGTRSTHEYNDNRGNSSFSERWHD